MKQLSVLFFLFCVLISCKTEKQYTPRTINSVTITEIKRDSTSIRAILAIDANKLTYAGSIGDITTTEDGGKTWSTQKLKYNDYIIPHFRSIAQNNNDIFVLSVANPALLYKKSQEELQLVYIEKNEKVFYDSMKFFADGKHGIAVGDPTEDCPSVILTSNGGNTWTKLPCTQLPNFEEGEAFFAASNTNISIVNNTVWIGSGGTKARILKSTDFGNTWEIFDTPIVQGDGPQGIYSIDFNDENHGIAIGGNYSKPEDNLANKAVTSDGGKTWTLVANNQNPNYKSCVQYVPNTNGKEVFAVGKTGVSFSNDGGHTWTDVSKEEYYSIQFVDSNTAWLSGHEKIGKLILN
ncbi:WD40/YVTN/BNR-like repeat-containing protein [Tenacibaculum sp. L6]|uniref:WD40/YVTN/BNR-like repeat-containing protein n=1 Tax=Tenacibaculum sp. L6 TaxID=2992764 RepID=UPI00237A3D50|nr:oxidoreductase [Tenacibaculum sp. L6]MDE0536367.1 oxidoreductase [Tenacibaculum sp. L6]